MDTNPGRATVRALCTMWRNARIYAPDHPRVTTALEASLQQIAALRVDGGTLLLQIRDRALWVGSAMLALDDKDAVPLVERLREVGLRGLEFGPTCSAADLRAMLHHVQVRRGRSLQQLFESWPVDPCNLRPLQLVYDGHFDASPAPEAAAFTTAPAPPTSSPLPRRPGRPSPVPEHLQKALQSLGADPAVRARLRAVNALTQADAADATIRVDVLERIGTLLPADVGTDSESIETVVKIILERLERDLAEVVRLGARVRGGGLLRLALDVARQFFRTTSTPEAVRAGMPSGRPEDDKITADVDLLLAELEDIPPDSVLTLPKGNDLGTAREVLGAFLHTLVNGKIQVGTNKLADMLRQVFAEHGDRLSGVLDPYLRSNGKEAGKEALRLQILQALVEVGGSALPCVRRFVDVQFFAARFPELLPLCARALGGDQGGREVMRQGLEKVAPMLELGGLAAAERSLVLADPIVVEALLTIGGPLVRSFLPVMARQATGASLDQLLVHARTLPLPAAAAATLDVSSAAQLPEGHLARVLTNFVNRRPEGTDDPESRALLNSNVVRAEKGPLQPLLRAIDALRHAGGPTTVTLLQRLSRHRRYRPWDRNARLIRQRAAAVLRLLDEQP